MPYLWCIVSRGTRCCHVSFLVTLTSISWGGFSTLKLPFFSFHNKDLVGKYFLRQCQYPVSYTFSSNISLLIFSSVQSLSRVWLFAIPWIAARQASLSITISRSSLKLTSIELVMPSSHLILCRPLLLLPPIPPSIRVFSNESTVHIRGPKYWSFSFSIIPSKEYPGLISFRMDWLDLLEVQGTLKRLLQHHSSKASILWCSAFFTVQLSYPYIYWHLNSPNSIIWFKNVSY